MEAIIASVILGVALAVMVSMATNAIKAQAQGEDLATAAMLADEQLNLVLMRGPDNYGGAASTKGQCDPPFERFRYDLAITGGSDVQPYDVKVTISWPAVSGERSVTVATLMAGRPGDDPDPVRKPDQTIQRPQ